MKLTQYEISQDYANEGARFPYEGDGRVLLRPAGPINWDFQNALHRKSKDPKYARKIKRESITPKENRILLAEVYAKTILIGWDNFEEGEIGQEKPCLYSQEKAQELLTKYPNFFDFVIEMSKPENFADTAEIIDETKKSSEIV